MKQNETTRDQGERGGGINSASKTRETAIWTAFGLLALATLGYIAVALEVANV